MDTVRQCSSFEDGRSGSWYEHQKQPFTPGPRETGEGRRGGSSVSCSTPSRWARHSSRVNEGGKRVRGRGVP